MINQPWPTADLDRLKRLWDDGLSASLIAVEMGRTRNAIIGKVHRLQLTQRETLQSLPHNPWPAVQAKGGYPRNGGRDTGGGQQQKIVATISRNFQRGDRNKRGLLNGGQGGGKVERIAAVLSGTLKFAAPRPPRVNLDEPKSLELDLLDLTNFTCKWATSDDVPHRFCGHATFGVSPYCPYHHRRSVAQPGRIPTAEEREVKRRHAQRDRRANVAFAPTVRA